MATGKGFLRIAIEDFLETWGIGPRIKAWLKDVLETWELEIFDIYDSLAERSGLDKYLPDWLKPGVFTNRQSRHQMEIGMVLMGIVMMVIGMLVGIFAPAQRLGMYEVDKLAKSGRPSPLESFAMGRRVGFDKIKPEDILAELGMSPELINGYRALARKYLPELEYITAMRRNLMSVEKVSDNLYESGMSREDANLLIKITEIIPTPNDLILMAVREAFDEDYISRYQTAEGISPEFQEWARKQGLGDEWSRRYWIAHWQLPSPQQVFEMLHRLRPGKTDTPIVDTDVNDYLKAADYSPFWRDKLKAISFNPFTRVDVRRMYKTGVLNAEQVKDAYLDLGYDNEKATALTEFTLVYEAEEETGVVRTSVIQAYGDGMITRATAESMLSGGGYDPTTIAFYLDSVDFRETLQVTQIKLQNIHKRFVEGILDETTVSGELGMLNLPAERVTAMLELWVTERQNQVSIPTLTQVENFYELGIATLDDFKRILKQRGYSQESINWNIERIDIEKSLKATKELEKAQADEERLAKSKTASKYQKDKAKLDLDIAQAKAEMTDIDIALHGELEDSEIVTFMARKDELKNAISEINVVKAQLHFDVAKALEIK